MSHPHHAFMAALPDVQRDVLGHMATVVSQAAPEAEPTMSSGVPAFRYHGAYLVSMNAGKHHLALYMMRGDVLKRLKAELTDYDTTNVAIRFYPATPLPDELITKLVTLRMAEIDA